jgi:hypothetical protein
MGALVILIRPHGSQRCVPRANAALRIGDATVPYTLAQAAKAVRRDKTTLLRAIKKGTVSAVRDESTGGWLIEPVELHRVYPVADAAMRASATAAISSGDAEVEIRELRARLADKDAVIEDLRQRLDREGEERRQAQAKLTALLTDRREMREPPRPRRSWWRWRTD